MFCHVWSCRHNKIHTTFGHRCGKCHKRGHGQRECNSEQRKQNLVQYKNDVLPESLQCRIPDCLYKKMHTTESHVCKRCNTMGHGIDTCSQDVGEYQVDCPICRHTCCEISKKRRREI